MSCDALFSTPDPPPSVHSGGTVLVASASGANELAASITCGRGADIVFAAR